MQVLILTEGFKHTGYGHVSRCMAIAQSFQKRNIKVTFLINGDDHVVEMLQDHYPVFSFNWLSEHQKLIESLSVANLVVIDSYLADSAVYRLVRERVSQCVYLDDFNRLDYPEGIIMNGTVGAEFIDYQKKDGQEYLLGKDYIILREAFGHLPSPGRLVSDKINRILVTFGGTDPLNVTTKVLSNIVDNYANTEKCIILGAAFTHIQEIKSLADIHTKFYYNVGAEEMKDLMLCADVAISAAGQTINELAITGLPSVIFKVADNQDNNITGWLHSGFIDSFIDATEDWPSGLLEESLSQLENREYRMMLSTHGRSLVDGKGTDRLVKTVLRSFCRTDMKMNRAEEKDLLPLFELANDKEVRGNSFSTEAIPLDEHTNWFRSVLNNPARILYVFYLFEQLVGQIRFDKEGDYATISLSLAASFRGVGLATSMLKIALNEFNDSQPRINRVYAYVKSENVPSQRAFLSAGFVECLNDNNDALKYSYVYGS